MELIKIAKRVAEKAQTGIEVDAHDEQVRIPTPKLHVLDVAKILSNKKMPTQKHSKKCQPIIPLQDNVCFINQHGHELQTGDYDEVVIIRNLCFGMGTGIQLSRSFSVPIHILQFSKYDPDKGAKIKTMSKPASLLNSISEEKDLKFLQSKWEKQRLSKIERMHKFLLEETH